MITPGMILLLITIIKIKNMKKFFGILAVLIVLFSKANSQGFYQLSFKNINGDTVTLNSYVGKKIFFFVAPLNASDSNFIQLQAFKSRYLDTVQVIGVLSFEDGYQSSNASQIQSLYNNMGIVLTEGMYTKKTSGSNQSALMKWLTSKNMNTHFDIDAEGIGHKFFVSTGGRLFAVMPRQVSLGASIINRIVQSAGQ